MASRVLEREICIDNLLVRVHWIIEMIVVELRCAIGVQIPDFQVAIYLLPRSGRSKQVVFVERIWRTKDSLAST